MKNLFGQYELSEIQMKSLLNTLAEEFRIDTENAHILHSNEIKPDRRHVDTLLASNGEETYFVSLGCSAAGRVKKSYHSETWFTPFVEAYLTVSEKPGEISDELCSIYNFLIRSACRVTPEDEPQYELCLLNGYEYCFIDDDQDFHKHKGYWGMFICPQCRKKVDGVGEVLFYRLIPAYQEELLFVEKHEREVDYHDLCQAFAERLAERKYFDVSYDKLSSQAMSAVLRKLKKNQQ